MIGLLIVVLLLCFLVIARHLRRNYGQVRKDASQMEFGRIAFQPTLPLKRTDNLWHIFFAQTNNIILPTDHLQPFSMQVEKCGVPAVIPPTLLFGSGPWNLHQVSSP